MGWHRGRGTPCRGIAYDSPVHRSFASRLTAVLSALFVSLSAPGLALAHGLEHEHLAHEHPAYAHVSVEEDADRDHHTADDADHHIDLADRPSAAMTSRDIGDGDHTVALDPADHEHRHDHETVTVAPGARDVHRLEQTVTPVAAPEPPSTATELVVVRSAALRDRALLARPAPESGPPPRLRAPPIR